MGARMAADLAVDLGTACTRVVVRGRGLVIEAPTVVATQQGPRGRTVVAVGADARKMMGRTPAGMSVVRPVRNGVVADFEATEQLLRHLLAAAGARSLFRPRLLVCIPSGTTEVERRAVQESARAAGAREVYLVATAMAAAIGAGLPVTEPVGSVIIDTGAGRTDIGVISLGGLVVRQSLEVAGDSLDDAIRSWLRRNHSLEIAERTAETLKHHIGAASPHAEPRKMRIRGRDTVAAAPRELDVTTADIAEAIDAPINRIRRAVLETLRETPPELSADICERGILLCGGGSMLRELETLIREDTGVAVLHTEDPARCVARGAAVLLEDPALCERVAATV